MLNRKIDIIKLSLMLTGCILLIAAIFTSVSGAEGLQEISINVGHSKVFDFPPSVKRVAKTISKLPILGSIPVLGKLFSSSRFQNKESELVIIVSPQSINSMSEDELPAISKIKS